jgi:hypothetical protein
MVMGVSLRGVNEMSDEAISNIGRRLLRAEFHRLRNDILLLFILSLLISSCSTSTPPSPTPQVVSVSSTSATQPWLTELYDCAARQTGAVLSRVGDANAADIVLQLGEPASPASFLYQIDSEEILIVTQRQSPIQNLTLEQAQTLFMGSGDLSVEVWEYASDVDVQRAFDQLVMKGRSVTSSARVAVSPQQMSDTLVNQANTVGILPKHWKTGDSRVVFSAGIVPVLVIAKSEPQGVVKELLACLQK